MSMREGASVKIIVNEYVSMFCERVNVFLRTRLWHWRAGAGMVSGGREFSCSVKI